ncbi:GmrSD restriction endonuclease domain-containing protein, partial [Enterobacter roggenkampii]
QRFNEENPCVATNAGFHDFKAVIDGQQRLTSLYIGLCGTYAYKQPRVWWPSAQDDRILPPRKLYVDLTAPLNSDDELMMKYNFRFLTDKQYTDSLTDNKHHWFCLHEIFKYEQYDSPDDILFNVVVPELEKRGLISSEFSRKTLLKLYTKIRTENLIHYFNESSQDIDHVLDVFIRTNSG